MAKFKVDFTGVEDKDFPEIAPGKYLAKVEEISKEEGSEYPYLKWKLSIVSGGAKGLHINHITSLKPSALFNLRNTLIALGLNVPKSAVNIDPDKLVGKTMGIEVIMRPYEGKEYPNVKKTFPASEFTESVSPSVPATGTADPDDLVLDFGGEDVPF